MKTLYLSPQACHGHEPNDGHPECPERLAVIDAAVGYIDDGRQQPPATEQDLLLAHSRAYIDHVFANIPAGRSLNFLDDETVLSAGSKDAALHAVGAVLAAIDRVLNTPQTNAFCAVRPPGHHAHRNHAAGFCVFNNVAIGALAALEKHGLHRVAILDFDVHHGDGTQDIIRDNPGIFFASTYQYPIYSATYADRFDTGEHHNILNIPVPPQTTGRAFIDLWKSTILPKVADFQPQLILVSAGFDGHRNDPLGDLLLTEQDYGELMGEITNLADYLCEGRLVAVLEGGYHLEALSGSVMACLHAMTNQGTKNETA